MRRYPPPRPADLRALAELEGVVLSLFVPVAAASPDAAHNAMRHSRAVDRVLARWRELGADEAHVDEAAAALSEFANESSAVSPSTSCRAAYWSAGDRLRTFGLPFPVPESAAVAGCAVLRPIAFALRRPHRYRVLTLSTRHVALYEGSRDGLDRLTTPAIPVSLEAALGGDVSEPALQFHSGNAGGSRPVYHGQGGASRGREIDLERFHRRVARGLETEIADDVVPLVLAADARHRPGLEKALSRDVGLAARQLEGNAEHLSAAALCAATWPLVATMESDARDARDRAAESSGPLLTDLSQIAANAVMGRIRRLWVPARGGSPGRLDVATGGVAEGWGDDDLIESIAAHVLRRAGSVDVLEEEPGTGPISNALWAELR